MEIVTSNVTSKRPGLNIKASCPLMVNWEMLCILFYDVPIPPPGVWRLFVGKEGTFT